MRNQNEILAKINKTLQEADAHEKKAATIETTVERAILIGWVEALRWVGETTYKCIVCGETVDNTVSPDIMHQECFNRILLIPRDELDKDFDKHVPFAKVNNE